MQIELSKKANKYLSKQDKPTKQRIKLALIDLSKEPPDGDIKPMQGEDNMYRLRIGDFRIIFTIDLQHNIILVDRIAPRGDVYKKG